jgi:hypothetical protein
MLAEEVTLHGGPKHGEAMAIPEGRNEIVLDAMIAIHKKGELPQYGYRKAHYTRVFRIGGGGPTSQFEWSGYTTPLVLQS